MLLIIPHRRIVFHGGPQWPNSETRDPQLIINLFAAFEIRTFITPLFARLCPSAPNKTRLYKGFYRSQITMNKMSGVRLVTYFTFCFVFCIFTVFNNFLVGEEYPRRLCIGVFKHRPLWISLDTCWVERFTEELRTLFLY